MATVTRDTHLKENPYDVARAQLRRVADEFGIDESLGARHGAPRFRAGVFGRHSDRF